MSDILRYDVQIEKLITEDKNLPCKRLAVFMLHSKANRAIFGGIDTANSRPAIIIDQTCCIRVRHSFCNRLNSDALLVIVYWNVKVFCRQGAIGNAEYSTAMINEYRNKQEYACSCARFARNETV